jgi:hypothetical protein
LHARSYKSLSSYNIFKILPLAYWIPQYVNFTAKLFKQEKFKFYFIIIEYYHFISDISNNKLIFFKWYIMDNKFMIGNPDTDVVFLVYTRNKDKIWLVHWFTLFNFFALLFKYLLGY